MKSLEQVQKEIQDTHVIPIDEFIADVSEGLFTDWDGIGVFHDGEIETDIEIECNASYLKTVREKYPSVCWYGK